MKCKVCGMPATAFVTTTINGKTTQQYLCESCYRQQEQDFYHQSRRAQKPKTKEIVCPKCQTRLSEFVKTGFLGCPDCYQAFGSAISSLLPKIQGSTTHVPRVHIGQVPQETKEEKLKRLRLALHKATKAMEYDEADKIFKQIKELDE